MDSPGHEMCLINEMIYTTAPCDLSIFGGLCLPGVNQIKVLLLTYDKGIFTYISVKIKEYFSN